MKVRLDAEIGDNVDDVDINILTKIENFPLHQEL